MLGNCFDYIATVNEFELFHIFDFVRRTQYLRHSIRKIKEEQEGVIERKTEHSNTLVGRIDDANAEKYDERNFNFENYLIQNSLFLSYLP